MNAWIDFKALRANLNFEQVLRHYSIEVKRKGNQHHGYCPLPNHNGKRNSPSFSANLERGIFQCFGCGAKGNILEFAARMSNVDPKDGTALRKVALELQQRFCPHFGDARKPVKQSASPQPDMPVEQKAELDGNVVINAPLDFELKRLDTRHVYFERRGLEAKIVEQFGLGFCSKGMLSGRIAIPVHTSNGQLVGYCGRLADDKLIGPDDPKYKFPGKRERKGIVHEFRKNLLVYNAHRMRGPVDRLAIVEGFPSVWWITQMGFPNVVACMGSSCSPEQALIIRDLVQSDGRVWVAPDGDEAGTRFAASILAEVSPFRFIKQLKLDEGKQPTDYPAVFFREEFK